MGFSFNNKVIYLLSPDRWGTMRVSKHHYALELAEKGNTVYFIEPPARENKGIKITRSDEHPSVFIVSYQHIYKGQRFLPGIIFRQLVKLQVKLLKKAIGKQPHIVWCFDPYRFLNLKWFGAPNTIFFAADLFSYDYLPGEAYTADMCMGISDTIVEVLKPTSKPVHFINHGLNRHFAKIASDTLNDLRGIPDPKKKITVGYVGNLLMEAPDRITMHQVIAAHPDVQFIFWGQYEKKGNFVAHDSPDVLEFIKFLKSQSNVVLRGAVHPSVLSEEIKAADMFWICWQLATHKLWDGSNSHKILEYLSTGKPVVSHYMSTYKGTNFLDMLDTKSNDGYIALFSKVVARVKNGEPVEAQRKRITFAMTNTYEANIDKIEKMVQQNSL